MDQTSFRVKNGLISVGLWICVLMTVVVVSSAELIPQQASEVEYPSTSETRESDDQSGVDAYLDRFGYYGHHQHHTSDSNTLTTAAATATTTATTTQNVDTTTATSTHHSPAERRTAIKRMQSFFHLNPTGEVDAETKRMFGAARCGMEDIREDEELRELDNEEVMGNDEGREKKRKHRQKRYAVARFRDGTPNKWKMNRLTWELVTPWRSRELSAERQRQAIREAFEVWARIMPMTFHEVHERAGQKEPDIRLGFLSGNHGPPEDPVFDGKSEAANTLAHAWGPSYEAAGLPGDVHFDAADDWSIYKELLAVSAHELGHSMGLLHSRDKTAIMFPVYRENVEPSQDDLDGINYLYGPDSEWGNNNGDSFASTPDYVKIAPPWINHPVTIDASHCSGVVIDHVFQDSDPSEKWNDAFIVISGENVHKLTSHGHVFQTRPLREMYPGLPGTPDIALSVPRDQRSYFIKDNQIYAYRRGELSEGYPRSIDSFNFPEQPQFAMTYKDKEGTLSPFLFGENNWWFFDSRRSTSGLSRLSSFTRNFPQDVQFAVQWSDNQLYFISKDSYTVLDPETRRPFGDGPIAGKPVWLQHLCQTSGRSRLQASTVVLLVSAALMAVLDFI